MSELPPEVRQIVVSLPYFHDRVPMLYVREGIPYVPVVVLCRTLGVRMETHLPRWRKMLLWRCARKLPLQTPTRGKRLVWCLHIGALPLWYSLLKEQRVVPDRRAQLRQATYELVTFPDMIYQQKLQHYQRLRRFLFHFCTMYTDAGPFFEQIISQIAPFLDEENQGWLAESIAQGQELITEALTIARKVLQEQETLPLIDVYQPDPYGTMVETGSLPLLPIISSEDQVQFAECLALLREWHQDLNTFLEEQKHGQR